MKSKYAYVLVIVLLVLSVACSLTGSGPSDSGQEQSMPPVEENEPVEEENEPVEESQEPADMPASGDVQLDAVFESLQGGFSFNPVKDYEVMDLFGLVTMAPPGADEIAGPMISMISTLNESGADAQQLLDEMLAGLPPEVQYEDVQSVPVGDTDGLQVVFTGEKDGVSVAGRVVAAAPSNGQAFNLIAFFPAETYSPQDQDMIDAVLRTVQFFEPEGLSMDFDEEDEEFEGLGAGEPLRQWAVSATASSEFSSPDWGAEQAAGAPDTHDCGDYTTAWASADGFGQEWLELEYSQAVIPEEINIYQTNSPGQIVRVDVRDLDGAYTTVHMDGPSQTQCPYILTIETWGVDFPVIAVRIDVDQSVLQEAWNEIDAVELVGMPVP